MKGQAHYTSISYLTGLVPFSRWVPKQKILKISDSFDNLANYLPYCSAANLNQELTHIANLLLMKSNKMMNEVTHTCA